eukprot:gb/GEZN01005953.1/.p1 GENE.gb/GEZN01005953.1/~~gb/GEZN01005953.1/.p1  ORF type:complete len:563 (-),score=111.16 gb/GEZN01005953.1/:7-1695(-)
MSGLDYCLLRDGPPWPHPNPLRIVAGGLGVLLSAGVLGTGLFRLGENFFPASDTKKSASSKPFHPRDGIEAVLVHPGLPGPAQTVLPLFSNHHTQQPLCLFSYANSDNKALTAGATVQRAWLYGARMQEEEGGGQHSLAWSTGLAGDVLKGRLLCWPIEQFPEKLAIADQLFRYRSQDTGSVRRSIVRAVLKKGKAEAAWWFFQPTPEEATPPSSLAKKPAVAARNQMDQLDVLVFANEVGAIAGLNPYQSVLLVFETVWSRTRPIQFQTALSRVNAKRSIEKVAPIAESREAAMYVLLAEAGASEILARALQKASRPEATVQDVKVIQQEVQQQIQQEVSDETFSLQQKQRLKQYMVSAVAASYGSMQEESAKKQIEEEGGQGVLLGNAKFYKRKLPSWGLQRPFFVGGRVDGFVEGRLVEIKNRVNKFLNPLPAYDLAQFQTYLFILGLSEGTLVERLKSDTSQLKETQISFDPQFWEQQLSPSVTNFCDFLSDWVGPLGDTLSAQARDRHDAFLAGSDQDKEDFIKPLLTPVSVNQARHPPGRRILKTRTGTEKSVGDR